MPGLLSFVSPHRQHRARQRTNDHLGPGPPVDLITHHSQWGSLHAVLIPCVCSDVGLEKSRIVPKQKWYQLGKSWLVPLLKRASALISTSLLFLHHMIREVFEKHPSILIAPFCSTLCMVLGIPRPSLAVKIRFTSTPERRSIRDSYLHMVATAANCQRSRDQICIMDIG